jgi:hypothetical protein
MGILGAVYAFRVFSQGFPGFHLSAGTSCVLPFVFLLHGDLTWYGRESLGQAVLMVRNVAADHELSLLLLKLNDERSTAERIWQK